MSFQDENYFRRQGHDKTPDIKLDVPIVVSGGVVNWIESKALFGDEKTHREYLEQQLTSYANRYEFGCIWYWVVFKVRFLWFKVFKPSFKK